MKNKLKILVTNDDGYLAPGIKALAQALATIAQVETVGPEQNSSAMSSCLTIKRPLQVFDIEDKVRFVTGTPADSVYIAINGLLDYRPDLIVSGINDGANMGDDTIYSGTVAAAMMGYMFGIPSIAFSLVQRGWEHLDTASRVAIDLVNKLEAEKKIGTGLNVEPFLLNVNVPSIPYHELGGYAVTRLGRRAMSDTTIKTHNPYGDEIFWLGIHGEISDATQGTDFH
ncbi:MAG: 5'/3'-nucleotidase SurE, partial [Saezia sp.]